MKDLLAKAKAALAAFLANPLASRALHTFWQAALAVLVVGLLNVHTTGDAKLLLIAAIAAGLSALKTMAVAYLESLKG